MLRRILFVTLVFVLILPSFSIGKQNDLDGPYVGEDYFNSNDNYWLHKYYDQYNSGFTPATGKGNIKDYRMKILGCRYLIGMGRCNPAIADIDNDDNVEVIFGTLTGYLYSVEQGKKLDWAVSVKESANTQFSEIGDVNGDDTYEVIIANDNLLPSGEAGLRVIDNQGNIMAVWYNPKVGWPLGQPQVVDIDDDGCDEILVGVLSSTPEENKLYALSYKNGNLEVIWQFPVKFWIHGPPAVGDINNDGEKEIVFSSFDLCVYCINKNGEELWNHTLIGGPQYAFIGKIKNITSPVIISDLDSDGLMEVLVMSAFTECSQNLSALYCLDHTGQERWRFHPGEPIKHSCAVGDLDGDGQKEIVFGDMNRTVYVLSSDGDMIWTYRFPSHWFYGPLIHNNGYDTRFSPSLVDLDGNGNLEIVMAINSYGIVIFSYDGHLLKKWITPIAKSCFYGASIGDIDKDGDLEILFSYSIGLEGFFTRIGIIDQL